ncbi:hypothetical protein P7K49_040390, partial [Saguinus oedipus]
VTVQSFGWSDRAKVKTDDIARIYQPKRYALSPKTTITMAHLLAAREDLSKIIRTSSGASREKTACAINKVLMGRVPDRGGRPNEIEPPPPEMPPWQKRQEGGSGRGGWGGGGGGGGRGGSGGEEVAGEVEEVGEGVGEGEEEDGGVEVVEEVVEEVSKAGEIMVEEGAMVEEAMEIHMEVVVVAVVEVDIEDTKNYKN